MARPLSLETAAVLAAVAVAISSASGIAAGWWAGQHYAETGPTGPRGPAGAVGAPGAAGVPGPEGTVSPTDIDSAMSGMVVLTPGACPEGTQQIDRVPSSTMLDYTIDNAVEDGINSALGLPGVTERTITSDSALWFNMCQF
jgi:hypothetical protein